MEAQGEAAAESAGKYRHIVVFPLLKAFTAGRHKGNGCGALQRLGHRFAILIESDTHRSGHGLVTVVRKGHLVYVTTGKAELDSSADIVECQRCAAGLGDRGEHPGTETAGARYLRRGYGQGDAGAVEAVCGKIWIYCPVILFGAVYLCIEMAREGRARSNLGIVCDKPSICTAAIEDIDLIARKPAEAAVFVAHGLGVIFTGNGLEDHFLEHREFAVYILRRVDILHAGRQKAGKCKRRYY